MTRHHFLVQECFHGTRPCYAWCAPQHTNIEHKTATDTLNVCVIIYMHNAHYMCVWHVVTYVHVHVCIYVCCMCIVACAKALVNHKGVTSHMWKTTNNIARMQCADQEVNHKCVGIQNLQHCAEQQNAHHPCVQIQIIIIIKVELCAT